ncbi:unnamed protein product [Mytilus coruscus]|uniref:CCHC-type domain-containing protein n=1 Tax=Mytilus coruscus TaxID=42192 RepID=A0A6J8ES98_MYTCO|nr:unnamed protein product [Mytilus coruscus]
MSYDITLDSKQTAFNLVQEGIDIANNEYQVSMLHSDITVVSIMKLPSFISDEDIKMKVCSECLSPEHMRKQCPYFVCHGCGEYGHSKRQCKAIKCEYCHNLPLLCVCGSSSDTKRDQPPAHKKKKNCEKVNVVQTKQKKPPPGGKQKEKMDSDTESNNEITDDEILNLDNEEGGHENINSDKDFLMAKIACGVDIDVAKLESLKLELSAYELDKCRGAVLRSKAIWAVESDKNTKYFLNLEKYKQENNSIKELLNDNNESVYATEDILDLQYKFYKELYSCVDTDNDKMSELLDSVDTKIDDNDCNFCDADISHEEIYKAINQMSKNKSPGSDGLTVEFYCQFYNELRNVLFDLFNVIEKEGVLGRSMKCGATGAKINKQKSEILCVGYGELSDVETEQFGLQVCKDAIQLLGVYVGPNKSLCDDMNWKNKIKKVRSLLNMWLQRQLTLQKIESQL